MSWFEVDKGGLCQLLDGRDKSFILRELVQNAWDEPGVSRCDVMLEHVPHTRTASLVIIDDAPQGFYDLRHAYTMFANTRKRKDASKRGRFNLGEKQVLALCRNAEIVTTTGTVTFNENGARTKGRGKRQKGSSFSAVIPMTKAEVKACCEAFRTFIPPEGILTTLNGEPLAERDCVTMVDATLLTEYEDAEGKYRTSRRNTSIDVYEPLPGEKAMIYEMGLPIIETGDRYHYDIQQRVPMTSDRDNVRPSFLRDVRAEVLNEVANLLKGDEAAEGWVSSATEDERVNAHTIDQVMTQRFGEKRVVADPGDPMSKERAIAAGYTIVPSRALSAATWTNVRDAEAIPSSSKVFQTTYVDSQEIPKSEWSNDMQDLASLTVRVAAFVGIRATVEFCKSRASTAADYLDGNVRFNLQRLGSNWCRPDNREAQLQLIIHELAHEWGGHLDASYYNGLARIGAQLALADHRMFE